MSTTERPADMAALARELGEQALVIRSEIRTQRYPALGQSPTRYWSNLITLFDGSEDVHKVLGTTNAIESSNRMIREAVETERYFPQDRPS